MASVDRLNGNPFSLILFLLLVIGPGLAQADVDTWKAVFSYQKQMAEYGNPQAQVKLGEMYEEGHGIEQDYEKAAEWYQKAADQGFIPAQSKLSQLESRRKSEMEAGQRER